MNHYWGKIGEQIYSFIQWSLQNHPGKFFGILTGFILALLFIVLGFWQTLILIGLTYLGYYFGKCWDEGELPSWLTKLVHRISFKNKR